MTGTPFHPLITFPPISCVYYQPVGLRQRMAMYTAAFESSPRHSSVVLASRDALADTRWAQSFTAPQSRPVLESFSFKLYREGFAAGCFTASIVRVTSPDRSGWQEYGSVDVEMLWQGAVRTNRVGYWREVFRTGGLALEPDAEYWAVVMSCGARSSIALEYRPVSEAVPHFSVSGPLIHWQVAPDGNHYIYDLDGMFRSSFMPNWGAFDSGHSIR
jgi:hypothetical protein